VIQAVLPRPRRKDAIARIRNAKNKILAIPTAAAAIPKKPNTPATRAITKNTAAQ
jgi:hypothetical protein